MWRRLGLAVALSVSVAGFAVPAQAKRVALVVGIERYDHATPLETPASDARAVAEVLGGLQFETLLGLNLDRRQFDAKLFELREALSPGDVALVFFSGHGIEVDGESYLLPRDTPRLATGQDDVVLASAIALKQVLAALAEKKPAVHIVILDASRQNPFATRGRAPQALTDAQPRAESFILYAVGAGGVAHGRLPATAGAPADENPNSVFTRVLLPLLERKGLSLTDMAKQARDEMIALTRGRGVMQLPAYYISTSTDFYLTPAK